MLKPLMMLLVDRLGCRKFSSKDFAAVASRQLVSMLATPACRNLKRWSSRSIF
jgi:hypothetical protein